MENSVLRFSQNYDKHFHLKILTWSNAPKATGTQLLA